MKISKIFHFIFCHNIVLHAMIMHYVFFCYVYLPKCDPLSDEILHPCGEMYHDYLNACSHITGLLFECDYLPTRDGDIPCIYGPVWCSALPTLENATVSSINDTAEYSCSQRIKLERNKTKTCLASGQWSSPPQCLLMEEMSKPKETAASSSNLFVPVLTPLLSAYILIVSIIIVTVVCKIKSKSKGTLDVNRNQYRLILN